jgi:uncharacterized repeat protein (TIGR03847 family)
MASRELGPLVHLFAEAIGRPGERRFRLQLISEAGDSACLWLEKEQLAALGDALETLLKDEGYQYHRLPLDDTEAPAVFPYSPDLEMRIGQLSMGINRERQRIVLIGAAPGGPEDDPETLSLEFDFRRGHELRRQIADVVAAGRPPCPLCTGPMDPEGHVCVKMNGHHKQQ